MKSLSSFQKYPPWHITPIPTPALSGTKGDGSIYSGGLEALPWQMSPFPEAGWAGKQARSGEQPSRISASFLHGFFSLKLHLNPVRVGWAVGWRPRRLAGSPGPPRALREMRLWFLSWSWADVLMWSHMKSPCLWDSERRIKRKAPATVTSYPGDAPPGLQWLESTRFAGGGGDACPGYRWGQEAWY